MTDACVAHCKICATRECASKLTAINTTASECPSHSSMQLMRHGTSLSNISQADYIENSIYCMAIDCTTTNNFMYILL